MSFLHLDPWKFLNSSRKTLGRMGRNRGGRMRRNPASWVARGGGLQGKSKRGLSRTCRCAWLDGRWPEEVGPRRRKAGGSSARRRRLSGGEGVGWPGLGAARERGGARGGVCASGAAVEERGDGELELARRSGGRWRRSRGLGRETGERVRGLGCGSSPGAEARERRGAGVLPRACHCCGDVAADWGLGGAW